MPRRGRFYFTGHAIDRFREHFAPPYFPSAALRELVAIGEAAEKTNERTKDGDEIWRAGTGGEVRFVVRAPTRDRFGGRRELVVVTVLDKEAPRSADPIAAEE